MAQSRITRRSMLGSVGAASVAPALVAPLESRAALGASGFPDAVPPSCRAAFTVQLQLGARVSVDGNPGSHWAPILGGAVTGPLLGGRVQGGRMDWQAAGASLEVAAQIGVLTPDGRLLELRDHGTFVAGASVASTSPQLRELSPDGITTPQPLLVGRLDASSLAAGEVRLLAFEVTLT